MTFSILVAFSSYICSERLRSGPAALWISVWVLTQLKVAEPFVAASPCRGQPDAPRSPARRWHAPGSSLSLPVIPGRHFCERTCLQTNQAAVFSCRCLSAGDNSGFCLPTGNRPRLTTDTSLRLVATSRGQTLALLREARPSPANVGTGPSQPGSGATAPVAGAEGWHLPPSGAGGHCGNGSGSPVTPAHRFHVLPVPAQRS